MRDPIKCGTCGERTVELFNVCKPGDERKEAMQKLAARCTGCKEVTYIEIAPAAIRFRTGRKSSGRLTGGWRHR